jgi:hypothetical protein
MLAKAFFTSEMSDLQMGMMGVGSGHLVVK